MKKNLLLKKSKIENSIYLGGLHKNSSTRPSERIFSDKDESENTSNTKNSNKGRSRIQIKKISSKLTPNVSQTIK